MGFLFLGIDVKTFILKEKLCFLLEAGLKLRTWKYLTLAWSNKLDSQYMEYNKNYLYQGGN